jgi:hypothetical protein
MLSRKKGLLKEYCINKKDEFVNKFFIHPFFEKGLEKGVSFCLTICKHLNINIKTYTA